MAGQEITTSIDDLVKYLREHGETESSELAKALRVSESIVGTWSDVLEKAKIVKVTYKVGKMYVALVATTKGGVEVAKKTVEMRKDIAGSELAVQINVINQVSARIEEFKRYVANVDTIFKSRAGEVKGALDEIERLDAQMNNTYKKLKERKDYIDGLTERLNKSVQTFEQKTSTRENVSKGENTTALMNDIRNKLADAEEMIKNLNREFNKRVEENRKGFAELLDGVRAESRTLRSLLLQREKETEEYKSLSKTYGRDSETMKRRVAKEREKMVDDVSKASQEVGKVYSVAEKDINNLRKKLNEMKGQFGGFAELSDKINEVRSKIDGVEKKKEEAAKGLGELSEQLKAIATLDETNIAKKILDMETINKKASDSAKRVDELSKDSENIKKDIDEMGK